METVILCLRIIGVSIIFNAIFEWFIHGPMMHGSLGTEFLRRTHRVYHHDYHDDGKYSNTDHGYHVHIPWWAMMMIVGLFALVSSVISAYTGVWSIFWCGTITTIAYHCLYQYIHTLMHVPVTNRLDRIVMKTRIFQKLDAHHKVHHLATSVYPWGKMVNIGVLCTLGDHLFGTKFKGRDK